MQGNFDLEQYLGKGIENLIKDALKATLKNPKGSAFLLKYAAAANKAGKRRAAAQKRGEPVPPFLIASITGQCNLRCAGCYAQAGASCQKAEMEAAVWARIFTEANALGVAMILLAGGEPFLRPEVIAKAAECPDILFPIFTNGTVLQEREYEMLDACRNLVPVISVEGDEAATDRRRGEGVYARLTDTLRALSKRNLLFGASVTVTKDNLDEVTDPKFIDDLYQKGCKIIFYIEYVPVDSDIPAFSDAEREIFENRLVQLREKDMMFISFPGDEKHTGGCLAAGRGFFHIAANGDAEPCPFSPYSDTNLRDIPLKEALRSPLFAKLTGGEVLRMAHTGGCVLFEQKEQVERLLN